MASNRSSKNDTRAKPSAAKNSEEIQKDTDFSRKDNPVFDNNERSTVNEVETTLKDYGLELRKKDTEKRIYRRREDLDNPDLPPDAETNLLTSKIGARVSRAHIRAFNASATHYKNKRAALERAVELLANETGVTVEPD